MIIISIYSLCDHQRAQSSVGPPCSTVLLLGGSCGSCRTLRAAAEDVTEEDRDEPPCRWPLTHRRESCSVITIRIRVTIMIRHPAQTGRQADRQRAVRAAAAVAPCLRRAAERGISSRKARRKCKKINSSRSEQRSVSEGQRKEKEKEVVEKLNTAHL